MNGHHHDLPDGIDAAIDNTVRAMTQAAPPAGLRSRVLAGLESRPQRRLGRVPAFAAAAALVALVIGGLIVRSHLKTVPPPAMPAPQLASRTDIGLPAIVAAPAAPAPERPAPTRRTTTSRPETTTAQVDIAAASPSPTSHAARERAVELAAASTPDFTPIAEPPIRVTPLDALAAVAPPRMAIDPIAITPLTVGPVDTLSAAGQGDRR